MHPIQNVLFIFAYSVLQMISDGGLFTLWAKGGVRKRKETHKPSPCACRISYFLWHAHTSILYHSPLQGSSIHIACEQTRVCRFSPRSLFEEKMCKIWSELGACSSEWAVSLYQICASWHFFSPSWWQQEEGSTMCRLLSRGCWGEITCIPILVDLLTSLAKWRRWELLPVCSISWVFGLNSCQISLKVSEVKSQASQTMVPPTPTYFITLITL